MKMEHIKGLLLGLLCVLFLLSLEARANNIKIAWDFRTNEWKTIEFLKDKDKIKVYSTAEDITDMVIIRFVEGRNVFAIKEK